MIKIPNYEIGKLAGKGGVAEVYLAKHKLLDRTVAIKLISPAQTDDNADKRFLTEAKVVAGLRHPNIVSIYDVGVLEGKYYIIMEYLEGGDLKQNIKRGLSVAHSLKIIKQIASALSHAHEKGFIHRDIKSQNIMFRADGTAVLTDFGIVKDLAAESGYTLDGTSIGTPHYMSPEQAQGSGEIDWRTDLYSLGVTLYEVLTGSVPYNADSAIAVALKHIKDPVPKLPEKLARFQPIIDKSMAKSPKARFQSALELIHTIKILEGKDSPTKTIAYATRIKPRKKSKLKLIVGVFGAISFLICYTLFIQPYVTRWIYKKTPQSSYSLKRKPPAHLTEADFPKKAKLPGLPNLELVADAIAKNQYSEALSYIEKAKEKLPATSNEMLQKADTALNSKQFVNAGDIYNTILSIDPENTSAMLGLLYVVIQKQQDLQSKKDVSTIEYDTYLTLLNKAIRSTHLNHFKHLKINTIETVYESAKQNFQKKNYKEADKWVKAGLNYSPDHLRLKKLDYHVRAHNCFTANRLTLPENDNALHYYQQILQLDPDDQQAKNGIDHITHKIENLAFAAQEKSNFIDAVKLIQKARSISPENQKLVVSEWMILGDMYYSIKQFDAPKNENALYYYQKILNLSPGNEYAKSQEAKIKILGPLSQVRQKTTITEKLPAYKNLFSSLETVSAELSQTKTAELKKTVLEQIKEDITAQINNKQTIPPEFIALISKYFPETNAYVSKTQYDILIAKGNSSKSEKESADYYLKALELDPTKPEAKKKIEKSAEKLANSGHISDAQNVLKAAINIAPKHLSFNKVSQKIKGTEKAKTEISNILYQIKIKQDIVFDEKSDLYRSLFSKLESATNRYGRKSLKDTRKKVINQVKTDMQWLKDNKITIPAEFITLTTKYFPEMNDYVNKVQYDILINKGDDALSTQEKVNHYLSALALNVKKAEIKTRIINIVNELDKGGKNDLAVAVLQRAIKIRPDDQELNELYGNIEQKIKVFPTASGCGQENIIIFTVPVSDDNLTLCIQYKNLDPDTIVNVVLEQKDVHSMEVPVVLDGRSGNKPIVITAPIEGFVIGDYSISIKKDNTIISETQIQFVPKRR